MRLALAQLDTGWHDPERFQSLAVAAVASACAQGAHLVAFPEMANTGFTMDSATWAEPLDGPTMTHLRTLARAHGIELLAALPTRRDGKFYNTAAHIGRDGECLSLYDKQSLFAYAGEHAHYHVGAPGRVSVTDGVRWVPRICYDLRSPELFRSAGPSVDLIVVIANWPATRRAHWEQLLGARAIENQTWVVGLNRVGEGGGLAYAGGSRVLDPWGELVLALDDQPGVTCVDIDAERVTQVRSEFPFTIDRRSALVTPAVDAVVSPAR